MKIINLKQGTDEWRLWRATGFGASDSAAILGESSFDTPYSLWCRKTGRLPYFSGNIATNAGKEAEDKAKAEYEMFHGEFEVFEPICIEHDIFPDIMASLDGFSKNLKRLLEIKYPSDKSHQLALSGMIPRHYWIQIQHQLAVCDEALTGDYWSYREGNGAKITVQRDEAFINDTLIPGILKFKEMVNCDIPPDLLPQDVKITADKDVYSLMEELRSIPKDDKENKNLICEKIIQLAGHPKVKCANTQVTSVFKNGAFSYYKVTLSGG